MRSANPTPEQTSGFVLKGWHVGTMLAAFFATVIGVNITFMMLAYKSFPGEDVPRSYVQGLKYNETLATRAKQATLGWNVVAQFDRSAAEPTLIVSVLNEHGRDLVGATVTGTLRRAVTDREDRTLQFVETSPGDYRATLPNLARGAWTLRANAALDGRDLDFTGSLAW